MARILLVDAESSSRQPIVRLLTEEGHDVLSAPSLDDATDLMRSCRLDACLAVADQCGEGLEELLAAAVVDRPAMRRVVVLPEGTDAATRQRWLFAGAERVLAGPLSPEVLADFLSELPSRVGPGGLVGASPGLRRVEKLIEMVAPTSARVLILGESGVGKELVARGIHECSSRKNGPFVALHCGALSPHLLESELFGHVKGSFTDAQRDRAGCFEKADGGTLFLDEISTMSADAQTRLLRVLEESCVKRVGSDECLPVDVRVIAASNQALEKLVADGRFRQDLYYRINVFKLDVPALRNRRDDILPLAQHFMNELAGEKAPPLSAEACGRLEAYDWPGNVRELRNAMERALILSRETAEVTADQLRLMGSLDTSDDLNVLDIPEEGLSLPEMVHRLERGLIERALSRSGGSRAEAARLLGLKRTTLVQKLKRQHELDEAAASLLAS